MPSCTCQSDHCQHHTASEPCPNSAIEPFSRVIDLETGRPIEDSARVLCRECWEDQAADYHEQ
jgi:hypothetical protein